MSVTIPSLDPVTDILDTDKIMVTQSSGQTYTIDGASFNKRNQAVIANSTTLTGAPLKTGNIVRAYFTADITGVNTTTGLVLNYNGSNKNVKVPKDGALVNFTAQNMGGSPTVYKYLQAYTTLELLYDGTNFVIIGNPVVISSADYTIYADGKNSKVPINSITQNETRPAMSGAVYTKLLNFDETKVTIDTPLADANTASINSTPGVSKLYYVTQSNTNNLPSAWNGVSGRGILRNLALPGAYIQILFIWGYNNTSEYKSKSGLFMRSAYYSGVNWVWESWRTVSL